MNNMITEAEAVTKRCPHFKDACLGSACMAWRFGHSLPAEEHAVRENGPWDQDSDEETVALVRTICGAELAQKLEAGGIDEDGNWAATEAVEKIDDLLIAHYEANLDAFKADNKPEGDGWEENTAWADHEGMYVEWIKKGPPLGYCGYAR